MNSYSSFVKQTTRQTRYKCALRTHSVGMKPSLTRGPRQCGWVYTGPALVATREIERDRSEITRDYSEIARDRAANRDRISVPSLYAIEMRRDRCEITSRSHEIAQDRISASRDRDLDLGFVRSASLSISRLSGGLRFQPIYIQTNSLNNKRSIT